MFAANTYLIHLATDEDAASLSRLAEHGARGPLLGPALIGHINGEPAAAILLADSRIIADPRRRTDHLVACLRVRANALHAYEATPSLRSRMLAALSVTDQGSSPHVDHRSTREPATTRKPVKDHRRRLLVRPAAASVA